MQLCICLEETPNRQKVVAGMGLLKFQVVYCLDVKPAFSCPSPADCCLDSEAVLSAFTSSCPVATNSLLSLQLHHSCPTASLGKLP